MGRNSERAVDTLRKGYNCAQAVLSAYAYELGLDRLVALKVASGFGGGMGRLQSICGAVTGAFMAIGYRHGMTREGDSEAKERTYAMVQDFARRFESLYGSILCSKLLGCDLNTPEGQKHYKEKNLFEECARYVADAADLLGQVILKDQ